MSYREFRSELGSQQQTLDILIMQLQWACGLATIINMRDLSHKPTMLVNLL